MKKLLFIISLYVYLLSTLLFSQQVTINLKNDEVITGKIESINEKGVTIYIKDLKIDIQWDYIKNDKSTLDLLKKYGKENNLDTQKRIANLSFELKQFQDTKGAIEKIFKLEPQNEFAKGLLKRVEEEEEEEEEKKTAKSKKSEQKKPPFDNLAIPKNMPATALDAMKQADELIEKAKKSPKDVVQIADQAISLYRKARGYNVNLPIVNYKLGIALQFTKEFDEAKQYLEYAIKYNPNFYEAFVELGDAFFWMKKLDKAIENYDKALQIYSDYAPAYRNRALILIRQRKVEEAIKDIKKAYELDSNDTITKAVKPIIEKEAEPLGWDKTFTKKSEHYEIITNDSQEFADTMSQYAEKIYSFYSSLFPKEESEKPVLPIIIFKDRGGYIKYGGPPNSGGYYSPIVKKLVFYKQPDLKNTLIVLYHEGFHQFLHLYIEDAPQWFNEGHADYFGAFEFDLKSSKPKSNPNPWRLPLIQTVIKNNSYKPLSEFLIMTQEEMYNPQMMAQNYAQAWSLIYFLWENKKYTHILKNYYLCIQRGYGLRKSYQETFGKIKNKDDFEKEWKSFILKLKVEPPKDSTGKK